MERTAEKSIATAETSSRIFDCSDKDSQEDVHWIELLSCLLNIGDVMVSCGGDIRSIERTLGRVGRAYGASNMNVLVITAVIIVTVTLPCGQEYTQSRRIIGAPQTDFEKLEALSDLCRQCCEAPLSVDQLKERFWQINASSIDNLALYGGGILSTGAFAVFFGGSWIDAIFAALIGVFVCFTMRHWRNYLPNTLIYNFVVALAAGMLIGVAGMFVPGLSTDMVTIGVIMVLIPGVAMTNAIRDLIAGDTISGVMRLVESLLWAVALALGFMLSMYLIGLVG